MTKSVFAWSLSEDGNDLNQWRAYCPNGGVAVGFRQKDLDVLADKLPGTGLKPTLKKCIYEEQEQRELIHSWIDKAINDVPGPRGPITQAMKSQIDEFRALLLEWFLVDKPIKHKAFKGEKEWRLVKVFEYGTERDERLGFRSLKGLIIPFWKVNLDPDNKKEIWKNVRVTVGPCPHPYELKVSVENLLKHYCTGPTLQRPGEVKNSGLPYRYW